MPKYTVTFVVGDDDEAKNLLAAFLQVGTLAEFAFHRQDDVVPQPRKKQQRPNKPAGKSGPDTMLDLITKAGGRLHKDDVRAQLTSLGYAPSASHTCYLALRKRRVPIQMEKPYYVLENTQ